MTDSDDAARRHGDTRARAAWLREINADRRLAAACFKTAYYYSDFSSVRSDGCAWPSLASTAKATSLAPRTVQSAQAQLEKYGYIKIERRHDQRKSSVIRPSYAMPDHHQTGDTFGGDTYAEFADVDTPQLRQKTTSASAISARHYGKKRHQLRQNLPPSPSKEPSNLASAVATETAALLLHDREAERRSQEDLKTLRKCFAAAERDRSKATVRSQVERDVDRVLELFGVRGNKADRRYAARGLIDLAPHDTDTILAALQKHIGCTREGYAEILWRQLRTRPLWRAIEYALPRGTPQ